MGKFVTFQGGRWPLLLMLAGGILSGSVCVRGDIVEQSYGDSKGGKSATGYVFQGSRNMKRQGKRRSTTSSVILPPLTLEVLSRKAPEVSVSPSPSKGASSKPRFGYGSDYQSESSQPSVQTYTPSTVDPANSVRFVPVKRNRTFYSRNPYYGFSSAPYFYRPGSAGRYYFHSPGCYGPGFSGGTRFNVYHGGNLTFSSWDPGYSYRYYR